MTTVENERGLAMLLQASRDFALKQLVEGRRVIPFGARASAAGDIDFIRFVDEDTEMPLEEVHQQTQAVLAEEAQANGLMAAAVVATVGGVEEDLGAGFATAVRVDIEAPGYARIILTPYRFDVSEEAGGQLVLGDLVTFGAEPVIFAR